MPGWPQYLVNSLVDARVPLETAERRANVPHTVDGPDGEKTLVIAFVETVAVVRHQVPNIRTCFQLGYSFDESLDYCGVCIHSYPEFFCYLV